MTAKYGGRRCGHLSSQERCEKVLSVCIATFNGAKYIREQLDSILCQLSPEDEVIISDDGSADQTLDILAEYQKKIRASNYLKVRAKGLSQISAMLLHKQTAN